MAKKQTPPTPETTDSTPVQEHHDHDGHDHAHGGTTHPLLIESRVIDFTIPWEKVQVAYQKVIKKYQPHVKTDGFRKGKAPAKIVEQIVGLQQLFEDTAQDIVPQAYIDAVVAAAAKPLSDPEIHPVDVQDGKDWKFHAHIAEYPEITLGDYKAVVKKALKELEKTKDDIKEVNEEEKKPLTEEQIAAQKQEKQINAALGALQSTINPKVPELLVRQETNRLLQQLEKQLKMFNIEPKNYFASVGKSAEDVQNEYAAQAIMTWQLEFILDSIAKDQKIEVTDQEIAAVVEKEEKLTPEQKEQYTLQVRQTLRKQKVIDLLLSK